MNDTKSAASGRRRELPRALAPPDRRLPSRRRVGLLDRLALHLGIALITWSRRTVGPRHTREQLALRHAQNVAAAELLRAAEVKLLLSVTPWRI